MQIQLTVVGAALIVAGLHFASEKIVGLGTIVLAIGVVLEVIASAWIALKVAR